MLKIGQTIEFKTTIGWVRAIVFSARKYGNRMIYQANAAGSADEALRSGYDGFDSLWLQEFPNCWRIVS